MKFTIYQNSRQGPRPYNQDRLAYSYSKDAVLLVLADGMGGHRHGEVAAQLAVKMLTDAFQREAMPDLDDPAEFLTRNIQQIHTAIEHHATSHDMLEAPRTTLVAAVLQNNGFSCAHVGDSRFYHFRQGKLLFKTEDHSIVQLLHKRGIIDKKGMSTHPDRSKIYNCLGGDKTPKIDIAQSQDLRHGDTFLLCSDGLWSVIDDKEIGTLLNAGPINVTVPKLLDLADALNNEGTHGDNISAIGLQWQELQDASLGISTLAMPLGKTTTIINPPTHQPTIRDDEGQEMPDLTDEEIEKAILEIQTAIQKTMR
ncbi:MAG TPA: protein phosphatase 2C domain-containing protein [Methylophilaceae bacterium]|nr:protein phosphatase 2C domain-containing protein [Methylophilaceae bacterium]